MEADRLSPELWNQIYEAIEAKQRNFELQSGIVTRREYGRMLVWCEKEFGELPLAMMGHVYRVYYEDDSPKSTVGYALTNPPGNPYQTRRREAQWGNSVHKGGYGEMQGIIPELPTVGEGVLVWLPYGVERFGFVVAKGIGYTAV